MIARHLALLAYIKSQHPYAVVTAQVIKDLPQHYSNCVTVRNDLNRLFEAGYIYNTHRASGINFYWNLSDAGKDLLGLPVDKEQAA